MEARKTIEQENVKLFKSNKSNQTMKSIIILIICVTLFGAFSVVGYFTSDYKNNKTDANISSIVSNLETMYADLGTVKETVTENSIMLGNDENINSVISSLDSITSNIDTTQTDIANLLEYINNGGSLTEEEYTDIINKYSSIEQNVTNINNDLTTTIENISSDIEELAKIEGSNYSLLVENLTEVQNSLTETNNTFENNINQQFANISTAMENYNSSVEKLITENNKAIETLITDKNSEISTLISNQNLDIANSISGNNEEMLNTINNNNTALNTSLDNLFTTQNNLFTTINNNNTALNTLLDNLFTTQNGYIGTLQTSVDTVSTSLDTMSLTIDGYNTVLAEKVNDNATAITELEEHLAQQDIVLEQVFQSASRGKELLAATLTGYGIDTNKDASYLEIKQSICDLYTKSFMDGVNSVGTPSVHYEYHIHQTADGTTYNSEGLLYSSTNPGGCYVGAGHTHNKNGCNGKYHTEEVSTEIHCNAPCHISAGPYTDPKGSGRLMWDATCDKGHTHAQWNDYCGGCPHYSVEKSTRTVWDCGSPTNTWRVNCNFRVGDIERAIIEYGQ